MKSWVKQLQAMHFSNKLPVLQQDVESKPSPVPVKGWDAISPLSNMEPDYGVILNNVVPRPGWVELRGGYNAWVQGISSEAVESLLVYRPDSAAEVMFAATSGDIWNVSEYGLPSISNTGFATNRWQYINFTPAGNVTYLVAVNGTDDGQLYNGSWSTFTVSGVNTANVINIAAHKRRIWLIERNSSVVYFLDTDAIAGTASPLDLGSFLTKGGNIIAMGTWTIDGGSGPDDYAVFISSEGQAVLYKGTDPANPNAWFLVGVFNLPPPIGTRCLTQSGSDLFYISLEGLLPISKALPFDPAGARSVSLTNRIQNAMYEASLMYRSVFGWETKLFPLQTLLLMNVPEIENSTQVQFVMNTLTGAWCKFTGWNANCFEIFNDSLYFGGNDGSVNLAYAGGMDLVEPIALDIKCAYNYYDDPGRIKVIQMVKPYIISRGDVLPAIGIDVDFGESELSSIISNISQALSAWGSAIWGTSLWAVAQRTINEWQTVVAIGTALAIRMKLSVVNDSSTGTLASSVFDTGVFDDAVFDGNGATLASGQNVPLLKFNQIQVVLEHGAPVG